MLSLFSLLLAGCSNSPQVVEQQQVALKLAQATCAAKPKMAKDVTSMAARSPFEICMLEEANRQKGTPAFEQICASMPHARIDDNTCWTPAL